MQAMRLRYLTSCEERDFKSMMPSNNTNAKEADEIQVAFSHDEVNSDDDVSLVLNSRLKWKLDLFILPIISLVYFFAQMVSLQN